MIDLYNYDCIEVLESNELEGKKVCIVTDPPFNINYKYNSYKDKLPEDEYWSFLKKVFTLNGFPFVVIHYPEYLYRLSATLQMYPEKVVSWVYNANTKKTTPGYSIF